MLSWKYFHYSLIFSLSSAKTDQTQDLLTANTTRAGGMGYFAYILALMPLILCQICEAAVEDHHHDYVAMLQVMKDVHEKCPDITHLYNLSGHPDHTTQDRKLAVIILSDNPEEHETGNSCESPYVTSLISSIVFPLSLIGWIKLNCY